MDEIPLHIVTRGHNREPCFFDEDDYRSYLYWLGKALAETECELHAYVKDSTSDVTTPEQGELKID